MIESRAVPHWNSTSRLNLHFHVFVLDGVYTSSSPLARPVFHETPPLTDQDVVQLTAIPHRRTLRYLQRRGRLPRTEHDDSDPPEPDEPLFAQRCAASVQLEAGHGLRLEDEHRLGPER